MKKPRHGLCHTRTYQCFKNMVRRCCDPKHPNYNFYSKLGLDDNYNPHIHGWGPAIKNFINDNGMVPENYEIDRIDNNIGYFQGNIQFITHKENMRKRQCVKLTKDIVDKIREEWKSGKYKTKKELCEKMKLCEIYGVHPGHIYTILNNKKWKD